MSLACHYWMRDAHHCSGPRLRNDLYCVEWDVKLYYTIPYHYFWRYNMYQTPMVKLFPCVKNTATPHHHFVQSLWWKFCVSFAATKDKLCGRPPQYAPASWPLTLKVVSESCVKWVTSVPILVFLGLSVLDLRPDVRDRQSDRRQTHIIA